jgi:hypothetical protein
MWRLFRNIGLVLGCLALGAWTPEHWFDKAKSPRIANYRIDATLDWPNKVVEGQEQLTWRNTGTAPTGEFPLHLYLNAFKGPQSRFFKESGGRIGSPAKGWEPAEASSWGYCRLLSVRLEDRELQGHFGEDETVYWVRLPRQVAPGETIRLDVAWESQFPKVQQRSGWSGDFLMGSQWFPKAGVYQGSTWTCQAYHFFTEFFADFGTYDVNLSLPNALLLAHTGTLTNFKSQEDITPDPKRKLNVIWKLHAEDVHDFAFAVMPQASWGYRAFEYRGIQVFCYFQPDRSGGFERQRQAVQVALKHAGEWYFPYPYPVLTVVQVPDGAEGADGMEYPTLVTATGSRFDPLGLRFVPEGVTVHELGHQWFYGMLASNEVDEPWLDEGLTNWFTHKAMERGYQALFTSRRFQVATDAPDWVGYWLNPSVDPLAQAGFKTRDFNSYYTMAYSKPTMVLNQLEAMLGRPMMEQVMQAYAREMAFRHPTGHDLKRIAEKVSGRDLGAFWHDFVEGTEVLDMVIDKVGIQEVQEGGWMDSAKGVVFAAPQPAAPGRRGTITLLRRGGLRLPITLWVRLENNMEQRVTWDGQERWATFEFEAPVSVAILDPDGNYPMLKDRLHGNYTVKPTRRGFHYWSQMAWGALTGLLQGAGLG